MQLHACVFGQNFTFKTVKEVLAKANEKRAEAEAEAHKDAAK